MEIFYSWSLMPKTQVLPTTGATNHVSVLQVRKTPNPVSALYMEPGIRGYISQNDGLIMTVGFELGNPEFGFSYDWNIYALSENAGGKNTLEFAVILRAPPRRYSKPIPSKKELECPVDQRW